MIDDDDVTDFALFGYGGPGLAGIFVFLSILIIIAAYAYQNGDDCSKRTCPAGTTSKLTSHECLCVTRPK